MRNFSGIVAWYSADHIPGMLAWNSNISKIFIVNKGGNFIYPMMHPFILYYQASECTCCYQSTGTWQLNSSGEQLVLPIKLSVPLLCRSIHDFRFTIPNISLVKSKRVNSKIALVFETEMLNWTANEESLWRVGRFFM